MYDAPVLLNLLYCGDPLDILRRCAEDESVDLERIKRDANG